MAKEKIRDQVIFTFGALEMLAGAVMSAFPSFAPSWLSWLLIGIGLLTVIYSLFSLKDAIWHWLLDQVALRANGASGAESRVANVRAVDSAAVRALVGNGDERDRLISLLQNGDITAWSRTQGFRNLRPVPPKFWLNDSLEFAEIEGVDHSLIVPHADSRTRPWTSNAIREQKLTTYHDVHFNKAQLKTFWPGASF